MRKLVFLVVLFAGAGMVFADVTVQDGMMTVEIETQPLQQILERLRAQTNITFSIDESIGSTQVSASFQDLSLAEGIKKMLEGTGINYLVVAGAGGELESIYIGNSEKPGATGKRPPPTQYRGVVQPVMPQQPVYTQPDMNNPDMNNPNQKPMPPGWQKRMNQMNQQQQQNPLPPTGGGYTPYQPEPSKPGIQSVPDNPNPGEEDLSDEEDDDEDEE